MTIQFTKCTYRYNKRGRAVINGFDYSLAPGLTILLGPNGAGKSTLLKIAAGLLRPNGGSAVLDAVPSTRRDYRRSVAWMPQHIAPVPGLTVREYVAYHGWLKGMSRSEAWRSAPDTLTRTDLVEHADRKVTQLSGGQLRRAGLACALVHRARIVLLDEPTAGLDPAQRRGFRDVLSRLAAEVPVLMSTHDVADLAREADQVTVLADGDIRWHGHPEDFLGLAPGGPLSGEAAEAAYLSVLGAAAADA